MSRKTRRNGSKNASKGLQLATNRFKYTRVGLSGLALGSLAFSSAIFAADAPTSSDDLSEIVVTGIRASLQKSLDIKREAIGVVDAISAEDIGQFPDTNVAAAMQRIPGVTVSRGTMNVGGVPTTFGDATAITVRGFGPQFNETLFDGRPVSTATGNRGFDFNSLGADFVSVVQVLKTPDYALSGGAIGATVNILYPKPFDHPGLRLAGSLSADYSASAGKAAPSAGILFSDTIADDTFGILADVGYSEQKIQANHVNIQGWEGFQLAPSQLAGAAAGASTVGSIPSWDIQDYGIYQEHDKEERVEARLALQWHPNDALMLTLDDNYNRDTLTQDQYGYSVWFNQGALTDVTRGSNGTLTSFVQPNTPTDFQGQINGSVMENNAFGFNAAWDITSNFKGVLDASQSVSKLNPGGQYSSIDADVGYGPSGPGGSCLAGTGVPACNGTNVGIAGVGSGSLPYPTGYGPNGNAALFINNGIIGSHVLPIGQPENKDTTNQFKIEGQWSQDKLKAKFGFQYVDDTKDLKSYDDFQNNNWQAYAGYGPASDNTGGVALPQNFFGSSFNTSNFIKGFANSNNLPPAILAYNPYTILNYLQSLGNPQTTSIPGANVNCCTPPFDGIYRVALNNSSVQTIEEKTYAPYLTIQDETPIGSMTLHESFGVRFDDTTVYSSGLGALPTALTVQASDHTAFQVTYGPTSTVSNSNNYKYMLPSLDLNLDVTDEVKVRFDASRSLSRPPLNLITPVTNLATSERVGSLVATGGNPGLLPYSSDNIDLGAEWYYARNSYASVDFFLKEVSNFIVGGTTHQTINGVIDPTTGNPAVFAVTTNINGPSAEVRGVELALQHTFWDTGFGLQANATFVSTNKPYNPYDLSTSGFAVTGLANSANLQAFWEKYGFHIHVMVNHRNEYLDHFGQAQNNSQFGTEPTFVNATTQVDMSASYDITKHFSVYFTGTNLNDSVYSTHGRFSDQLLDVVDYGATFVLGVRGKL
jgi:iron complex outermembrane recepter protein